MYGVFRGACKETANTSAARVLKRYLNLILLEIFEGLLWSTRCNSMTPVGDGDFNVIYFFARYTVYF